ncbi:tyrosine-type recombinase/integrase [Arthrobacter sp. AL12]|uniref:tyrosine-type recombinase/integrase n=1 Tax=Arthrobacter sp. AL12 TaxID=3042241 RepID=UPI00249CE139|nr:tyrosine-type recombinase/integrase [Arthrobacter sp. AL12]MDI3210492.1 tyrosine-type recombinase/integrase [Arthrobacter sp. AL12]
MSETLTTAPALAGLDPASAEVLEEWTYSMQAQDLSPKTIRERLILMRTVGREVGPLLTLTKRELVRWMAGKTWASSTRAQRRADFHTFFTWLQDEDHRVDNPAAKLPRVATRSVAPNPFTVDEINTLLNGGIYRRTRAMVALHYYLGLRVSEIARVHGRDINRATRTLKTIGKGRKEVTLPIPDPLWELAQSMPEDGYWFPNYVANKLFAAGEGHVMGNSISGVLSDAIKRAGLDHRPHQLRAATATEMHRAGVSAFTIQNGMRHSMMQTTTKYLLVEPEQIRAGLDLLPAVAIPSRSSRGHGPR